MDFGEWQNMVWLAFFGLAYIYFGFGDKTMHKLGKRIKTGFKKLFSKSNQR